MELLTDAFSGESTSAVGGQPNLIHDYVGDGEPPKPLAAVRQILRQRSA